MKININNIKKFASTGLVLTQILSMSGCKTNLREVVTYEKANNSITAQTNQDNHEVLELITETQDLKDTDIPLESNSQVTTPVETQVVTEVIEPTVVETIAAPITTEPTVIETHEPVVEEPESLLEQYDENPIVNTDLDTDIKAYHDAHMMEIHDVLNPEYRDIQVTYGAMVYQRLVNAGIPKETILGELSNVILEQQLPRCCSEEEWQQNFGNIVSVLGEEESMYDAYFCLAYLVHDDMCELAHEQNVFGAITCDNLEDTFQKKYNYKFEQ